MVSSKLELALVAVIAAGLLAIECEHRIVIGMPAAAEAGPPVASVCPSTDNVPIGAACMSFIGGGMAAHMRSSDAPPTPPDRGEKKIDSSASPCPASNETAPYSVRCVRFLSGWFWRVNSQISD
jgi:hypothetical protein